MDGLERISQLDFSAGAFRGTARNLIPPNGAYTLQNLLLDEDGAAYKRGGSAYLSGAAFGSGLTWVWDGFLAGGQRTVFASTDDFGVLGADGVTPVNLGGVGMVAPRRVAVLNGVLYLPGGVAYAGSRMAADYSAGTVTVTNGSKVVAAAGTAFLGRVDPGMLFRIGAERFYVVDSVDSETQITLADPYEGSSGGGKAYALSRLVTLSSPYRVAARYAVAGDKLVALEGRNVYLSDGVSETGVFRPHQWQDVEFHEMPAGVEVIGGEMLGDVFLVFTTRGMYAITNVYFPIVDDLGNFQRPVLLVNGEIVLWGCAGVAAWANALVVPATDAVWLVTQDGAPVNLSRSIEALYRGYVEAGYRPGRAAVFRGHYMLPVLDALGTVVDELVCRLDRPTEDRFGHMVFPWSWLRGHGGEVSAWAVRIGGGSDTREPRLLGAGEDGRVLDCSGFFEPAAGNAADADGSAPAWVLETRDFATGPENLNTVRRLTVRYELEDAGAADPEIEGYVSKGADTGAGSVWGGFAWGSAEWSDTSLGEFAQLAGRAGESEGRDPHTWAMAVRARHVRGRLQSSGPAARMVLRSLTWALRASRKNR